MITQGDLLGMGNSKTRYTLEEIKICWLKQTCTMPMLHVKELLGVEQNLSWYHLITFLQNQCQSW